MKKTTMLLIGLAALTLAGITYAQFITGDAPKQPLTVRVIGSGEASRHVSEARLRNAAPLLPALLDAAALDLPAGKTPADALSVSVIFLPDGTAALTVNWKPQP